MEQVIVNWLFSALICFSVEGEPCREIHKLVQARHVCENRIALLQQAIPLIRPKDYGWPEGTVFQVQMGCQPVTDAPGA